MSIRRSNLEQAYVRAFKRVNSGRKADQQFIDWASNDTLVDAIRELKGDLSRLCGCPALKRRNDGILSEVHHHSECEFGKSG